jgi:GT2 family glycosyltransferase
LMRSGSNLGFGGGNNLGFAHSHGDIVLILNPDVRLRPDALRAFANAFAADRTLGIAGAKLLYPDGQTLQHAGGIVDYPLATTRHLGYGEPDRGQYDESADVPFVTGAALALRREVALSTGLFDAAFYPVYYEDADLCVRARAAGWRVAYLPAAVGLHRSSATLDPSSETYFRFLHASRLRFVLKHYTTQQILADFLPAEAERLRREMPAADRLAARRVYRELGGKTMDKQEDALAALDHLVADLDRRWQVREQPFASHAPLLGPLIVRFRSTWNNVATRWYVQPMLQQQIEFNAAVVRAVQALARQVDAQESITLASRAVLGQRLLEIDDRLTRLEQPAPSAMDTR